MKRFLFIFIPLFFVSCASLNPVRITKKEPLDNYTYFYITPTESQNLADIISGFLIKRGMIRLPEIKDELADKTMIINYGETGRRDVSFGYTTEITLQILSAKNNNVICVVTGEGIGDTKSDDIRIAINRCLVAMFMQ